MTEAQKQELVARLQDAKNPAELMDIAREAGVEIAADRAEALFAKRQSVKLDDQALDDVSGGAACEEIQYDMRHYFL